MPAERSGFFPVKGTKLLRIQSQLSQISHQLDRLDALIQHYINTYGRTAPLVQEILTRYDVQRCKLLTVMVKLAHQVPKDRLPAGVQRQFEVFDLNQASPPQDWGPGPGGRS